ncbi:hypothetical protein SODALDRAFT_327677 [Sodiomyces alkalinus F11]|uniref:ORC6 first cyclin-like domain-containing protein n=1 Tax=Sodiomyces alkalinus (strain CBS 110278 / VKM F-3762 / F11) TaxID=1314773 RepID=A0A3N2Q9N9_SODAK|nr:hypothetical protein SODALDRAFT_327677 [Sodiomyces alkalinus F11]ROT43484.1 hypothetical protein SODALDRAFT_327677 [Sodiomyces alkalinus F11]
MSRSIEPILLSLMPTHSSALPPPVVELAGSLLAQSRLRASTLKTEEEVARLYACCHIACERLKISLNLPPIEPRPPIPPRIYKRLYAHLDNILPATGGPRTPGKNGTPRSRLRDTRDSGRPLPSRPTPGKDQSLAMFRSAPDTPSKSTGKAVPLTVPLTEGSGLHPWLQPTIRFICRETGYVRFAPNILAGVESIVAPGGRRTRDEWVLGNLTALCGVLYFLVTQQVLKIRTGQEINRDTYVPARKEVLGLMAKAREQQLPMATQKGLSDEDAWEGWHTLKARDFDAAAEEITTRGCLEDDWFRCLGEVIAAADRIDDDDNSRREKRSGLGGQEGGMSAVKVTVRRADTMFQDRYDFLSEQKRIEYRIWKEGITGRIRQLEKDAAPRPMDVDT